MVSSAGRPARASRRLRRADLGASSWSTADPPSTRPATRASGPLLADVHRAAAHPCGEADLPGLGVPAGAWRAPRARTGVARNLLPRLRRPISRWLSGEPKTLRLKRSRVTPGGTVAANPGPGSPTQLPATAPRAARASQSCPPGEPARSRVLAGRASQQLPQTPAWHPARGATPITSRRGDLDLRPGRLGPNPAWLLLRPVWKMSAREAAQIFVLVAAIHVPINLIGYAVEIRTAP